MTEIDGSLLRGARYCAVRSLDTMKVNRGCYRNGDKTDESGWMESWRWMKRRGKWEIGFHGRCSFAIRLDLDAGHRDERIVQVLGVVLELHRLLS